MRRFFLLVSLSAFLALGFFGLRSILPPDYDTIARQAERDIRSNIAQLDRKWATAEAATILFKLTFIREDLERNLHGSVNTAHGLLGIQTSFALYGDHFANFRISPSNGWTVEDIEALKKIIILAASLDMERVSIWSLIPGDAFLSREFLRDSPNDSFYAVDFQHRLPDLKIAQANVEMREKSLRAAEDRLYEMILCLKAVRKQRLLHPRQSNPASLRA